MSIFYCPICKFYFEIEQEYIRHMEIAHKIVPQEYIIRHG